MCVCVCACAPRHSTCTPAVEDDENIVGSSAPAHKEVLVRMLVGHRPTGRRRVALGACALAKRRARAPRARARPNTSRGSTHASAHAHARMRAQSSGRDSAKSAISALHIAMDSFLTISMIFFSSCTGAQRTQHRGAPQRVQVCVCLERIARARGAGVPSAPHARPLPGKSCASGGRPCARIALQHTHALAPSQHTDATCRALRCFPASCEHARQRSARARSLCRARAERRPAMAGPMHHSPLPSTVLLARPRARPRPGGSSGPPTGFRAWVR